MKKIVLSCFTALFFTAGIQAQHCAAVSTSIPVVVQTTDGFSPPAKNLPCAVIGAAASDTVYFKVPVSYSSIPINSFTIDSIENLPAGLCWVTNSTTNTFNGGQTGVIHISGTSNAAPGQYKWRVHFTASTGAGTIPGDLESATGMRYYIRLRCSNTSCTTLDSIGGISNAYIPYSACVTSNPPTASVTPVGPLTHCPGTTAITLTAASGTGYTYKWSTGSTNASISVTTAGTYKVTVYNATDSAVSNSVVVSVPTVSFTLPATILKTAATFAMNGTPAGGTYTGPGVNGSNFVPSAAGVGTKTVTYAVTSSGCALTARANTLVYDTVGGPCTIFDTVMVNVYDTITTHRFDTTHVTLHDTITTHLSVTDTLVIHVHQAGVSSPVINTISVYPNPAKDHVLINCGNLPAMTGYSIKVTNMLGQSVFNQALTQQLFNIDLSTWGGSGAYVLSVLDASQVVKK